MLLVVDFDRYTSDPSQVLGLMGVGGVFYGGLLLAVPTCWWYIRRNGLPLWTTCDLFAPGIALAQGVGRMGCLLAGCCFGRPTEAPWGITFSSTLAAANSGTPLGVALHPSQMYESIAVLLILGCCSPASAGVPRPHLLDLHAALRGGPNRPRALPR